MATKTYKFVGYNPDTLADELGSGVSMGEIKTGALMLTDLDARREVTYTGVAEVDVDNYQKRNGWVPV